MLFSPFVFSLASRADGVKTLPATPAQKEFLKGQVALTANKLAEAQACFQRSLELDPKLLNPLLGLAEVEILKRNAPGADQYLQKASALAPKDANVWTVRGHYLFFRKNYSEAEQAFKTAITLDPKLERPLYELGDLYLLGFHNPKEAVEAYRAALAINPNDSRVHYTLANALAEAGDLDGAQAQLGEAARLDPGNPALQDSLGEFYLRRRKLNEAEQAFGKALAISPNFVAARIGKGDVFVARRDLDQALAAYQAALQIAPKSTAALVKIGVLQELKGQWNEAEQAYRKGLAADPKLFVAANNLAWILNEHQKKPAEALKWATAAATLAPKDFNAQDTLGWVLRANGGRTRALATLKQANALAPDNPQILYHLGVVYQETKQPQLAIQSLSKALSLSKNFDGAADAQARLDALRRVS
jgi:tetratricopeptide (TPR) repeat protein